jgi:hypothetical protein
MLAITKRSSAYLAPNSMRPESLICIMHPGMVPRQEAAGCCRPHNLEHFAISAPALMLRNLLCQHFDRSTMVGCASASSCSRLGGGLGQAVSCSNVCLRSLLPPRARLSALVVGISPHVCLLTATQRPPSLLLAQRPLMVSENANQPARAWMAGNREIVCREALAWPAEVSRFGGKRAKCCLHFSVVCRSTRLGSVVPKIHHVV